MNEQYEKSLTKLELDKVLAMLSDHAASQAAKDRCLAVRPSTDADEIRHLLDETSAACACITVKGSPSFGGLYDVGASLDRADRGGCLSPEELLRIAAVLKSARQTKAYSEGEGEARRSRACWMCTSSRSPRINIWRSASSPPSSPRTRSRTRPAASLPLSAAGSASRARRSANRCRRSSPRRPTRRFCRSRS